MRRKYMFGVEIIVYKIVLSHKQDDRPIMLSLCMYPRSDFG